MLRNEWLNRFLIGFSFLALVLGNGDDLLSQTKKSLVIGIDGLGYGSHGYDVAATPVMDSLIQGTWQTGYRGANSKSAFSGGTLGTATQQPTVSGPGWTTMLTGVWTDQHRVTDNGQTFANGNFAQNPNYLGTIKSVDSSLRTASFVNWGPIDSIIMASVDNDSDPSNNLDFRAVYANDAQVIQAAANTLLTSSLNPDAIFVALDEVDIVGHRSGGSSNAYRIQIERSDSFVGQLLNAVANRANFPNEDWQIIITSDHGHRREGGHGGQSPLERTIPFIVVSKDLRQGRLPNGVSHADIAPTVLEHFQFELPGHYAGISRASGAAPGTIVCEVTDDFENVVLKPFTAASRPGDLGADGTDFVPLNAMNQWQVQNNFTNGFTCNEEAYRGWRILDRDSWICEQGGQDRNLRGTLGTEGDRNSVLVADPDAADDFAPGTGASPTNYNSYVFRDFDISSANVTSLRISLDFELRCEDSQRNLIEVAFDGGNFQTLMDVGTGPDCPNGTVFNGPETFRAGVDFTPPNNATSMRLRFGCVEAGNDWWFAIDNISIDDNSRNIAAEDFEGYQMSPFTVADCVPANPPVGDGTDFAGDVENEIPGWKIDNSGMAAVCLEEAYNGWRAVDADQWVLEQGSQIGRSRFTLYRPNNTIMLAEPDGYYDFLSSSPTRGFNSYVTRTYDLTGLDPTQIAVQLEWEFGVEDFQQGIIQVRFDDLPNPQWQTLLNLDSSNLTNGVVLSDLSSGVDSDGRPLAGSWSQQAGDFSGCGTRMTLRVGCINGDNDWWFAFDNVGVCGVPLGFVLGDANDDGILTNADIDDFVLALISPSEYQAMFPNVDVNQRLDMNCDGIFSNQDIFGFVSAITP